MQSEGRPPWRRNRGSFGMAPPSPQQRRGTDTLRQFGENVRHVPPVVARVSPGLLHTEPEDIDPYAQSPPGIPPPQGEYLGARDFGRYPYQRYQYQPYQQYAAYPSQAPVWRRRSRWNQAGASTEAYLPPPSPPLARGTNAATYIYDEEPVLTRRAVQAYSNSRSRSPGRPLRTHRGAGYRVYGDDTAEDDDNAEYRYESERESDGRSSRGPIYERAVNITRRRAGRGYDDNYWDEGMHSEGDYDELVGGKVFSFKPLRAETSESKDGDSGGSTEDLDEKGNEDGPPKNKRTEFAAVAASPNKLLQVSTSQYTGDAFFDGNHSAKITVVHDPRRSRQPLFRWLHLQQEQLNLDELSAEIASIPGLSDAERHGFTRLLSQVREMVKIRRTADGRTVKHMDPGSIRVIIQDDDRTNGRGFGIKGNKIPITWLCIPYFLLEKYSGLMAATSTASFPIETLLQSDYAPTGRLRDVEQQVVVRNGAAPEGECFHIDQVWCVVLGNSLLITCSRMSSAALRGDVVKIATEPLMEPASKARTLYVSYGESVTWALPLESCLNWFAFATHFHEFWPQAIRFYHRDKVLTEEDWPRIVNLVKHSNTRITIDLRLAPLPQPSTVGVLQSLRMGKKAGKTIPSDGVSVSQQKQDAPSNKFPENVNDTFHVFTWMDNVQVGSTASSELNIEAVVKQLALAEDFILGSTTMQERRAYHMCNWSSRELVYAYLEDRGKELESLTDEKSKEKRDYEDRVDIYNAAEIVFRFFLPWRFDKNAPTVGKFWAAVQCLVEIPGKPGGKRDEMGSKRVRREPGRGAKERNILPLRMTLRNMTRLIQSFQAILSNVPVSDRLKVEIPDGLIRAWLHLTMALIQCVQDDENWIENMDVADSLIRNGMSEIMDNLPVDDLLNVMVVQPLDFVSLLSWKLLRDSAGNSPDMVDTYSEYIKQLENEVTDNPDRSNQYRISQLRKEVDVIRRVIASQLKVLEGMSPLRLGITTHNEVETRLWEKEMRKKEIEKTQMERARYTHNQREKSRYYELGYDNQYKNVDFISSREPFEFSKLSSTDPGGVGELILRDCRSWIERRDNEFIEFDVEASRLEAMNATNIEITKDRQEKAVYAFTMVTIIFLPLSTISSIFGMNTSDIANLELTQWVYWATALPTTLLVIVGGLWWMGELENLIRWLLRLPKGRKAGEGSGRYAVVPQQPQLQYRTYGYAPVPAPLVEVMDRV